MDSDLWASRLAAAKRQYSLQQHQNSRLDRLMAEDFEIEEDGRLDYPCPYCYEDHDIASLCSHLEEEHALESKITVCPICSEKVTKYLVNHITTQHAHLFKLQRRRRLRRIAMPNSQMLALFTRDLREAHLQAILGNGSGSNQSNPATESLLSSLLNIPPAEPEETLNSTVPVTEDVPKSTLTSSSRIPSFDPALTNEEKEKKMKEASSRSTFVQDLVLTSLFSD